jgi:hypothetical protein
MSFRLARKYLDKCRKDVSIWDKHTSLFCATVVVDKKFYKIVASKEKTFFDNFFVKQIVKLSRSETFPLFIFV